jgi:predicted nucleic acid-binding protein
LARLLGAGDKIAIAPQVLAEFIHIVTDGRRFAHPLNVAAARQLAEQWWTANDVVRVFPDDGATRLFLAWLQQFSLGRKRLLDTLLAATYRQAGISSLLTTNPADFGVFGVFTCITPKVTA